MWGRPVRTVEGGWGEARTAVFIDGMTVLLLGRAERSTPEAEGGTPFGVPGVDGESASRAIIVVAHEGPPHEERRRRALAWGRRA